MSELEVSLKYILDIKIYNIKKFNKLLDIIYNNEEDINDMHNSDKIKELGLKIASKYVKLYELNIINLNFTEIIHLNDLKASKDYTQLTKLKYLNIDAHKKNIASDILDIFYEYDEFGNFIDKIKEKIDLPKSERGFYLNKFNEKISFDGNTELKKKNTPISISIGRYIEICKCKLSYTYFRLSYPIIITKTGLARPELRHYQYRYELNLQKHDYIALVSGRQTGKTISTAIYLLHCALYTDNINIGIAANRAKTAREILRKIKEIFINLPMWLKLGVQVWNTSDIMLENGTLILTDATSADSFRGHTCHIIFVDEVAFILPSSKWKEFTDSIFPSQSSLPFHKRILTSTMNGYNHWYKIVDGGRKKKNSYTTVDVYWNEPPGRDEEFKNTIIRDEGILHWLQNYENEPLGSANTFLPIDVLKRIEINKMYPVYNKYINGGKCFAEPEKGHKYILTADSAKDGSDYFGLHVIDVTEFPWRQAFSAKLQVNYLVMANYINNIGTLYNNAYVIIENNEGSGQSINDTLWDTYEYENLYRDIDDNGKPKKYFGFRTTSKSRKQILSLLSIFFEKDFLIIHDENTIEELFNFIEVNGKYQADDGYNDDLVMALALCFAPLKSTKGFQNQKLLINKLFDNNETVEKNNFDDFFIFGDFDTEYNENDNFYSENDDFYYDSEFYTSNFY